MKVLLVGLGLAFLAIVRGEDPANLDHEKLLGLWHGIAMATNCEKILNHREEMKIVAATLTKLEDGALRVASRFPMSGECKEFEMTFREGEDGKLVHECEWGRKEVDTVETDNENYAIVNISKFKDGQKICRVTTLFARKPTITAEYAEKFKSAAKEAGIAEDNMILFPQEVVCQEEAPVDEPSD